MCKLIYNFLALIQGGIGPDVWDKEIKISAINFTDAANQARAQAEELGGQVVALKNETESEPESEPSKLPVNNLCRRLNERILEASDLSLPDWADIELSLVRIISKRDELQSELTASKAREEKLREALRRAIGSFVYLGSHNDAGRFNVCSDAIALAQQALNEKDAK